MRILPSPSPDPEWLTVKRRQLHTLWKARPLPTLLLAVSSDARALAYISIARESLRSNFRDFVVNPLLLCGQGALLSFPLRL